MNQYDYEPATCECCGQTTEYMVTLSRGAATIVKAIAAAIDKKGVNVIHPTKEMEVPKDQWTYQRAVSEGVLTASQIGNLTRPRIHGLIAKYKDEAGNWVLTRKGGDFLRGEAVPRLAVVAKGTGDRRSHKKRYHLPDKYKCTIHELTKGDQPQWEAIGFKIQNGRIVDIPTAAKEAGESKNQKLFDL